MGSRFPPSPSACDLGEAAEPRQAGKRRIVAFELNFWTRRTALFSPRYKSAVLVNPLANRGNLLFVIFHKNSVG